jgi:hypothetical protein
LNFFEAQHDRQSKVPELAIAGLLRPLSLCGNFLRLAPKAAMAEVLIAIVVIDAGKFRTDNGERYLFDVPIVSGYGTAAARFAAYLRLEANSFQELGPKLRALPAPRTSSTPVERYLALELGPKLMASPVPGTSSRQLEEEDLVPEDE